ncbi:hypothetical protein P7K49_003413 [Saguinus oedipus]|uniref:Uncharacterized protein n=1 Tax=Saguinus oedipus TaxID=9490 RepID=A0ABQ9W824_SAGOE|nr:hypothetical protein P7K49_003413 [Saguinus oedipus]
MVGLGLKLGSSQLLPECFKLVSVRCVTLDAGPANYGPSDPQQTEGFRKRWFTMDDRRLMYFKDPLVRSWGCQMHDQKGGGLPESWPVASPGSQ